MMRKINREELMSCSKEQLIDIIMSYQDCKILDYYNSDNRKSKFSDITPERVAKLQDLGYSLSDIMRKINKEYKENGVLDENGRPLEITLQALMYRVKKFEKQSGKRIYRVGKKGRRKINPTLFN